MGASALTQWPTAVRVLILPDGKDDSNPDCVLHSHVDSVLIMLVNVPERWLVSEARKFYPTQEATSFRNVKSVDAIGSRNLAAFPLCL